MDGTSLGSASNGDNSMRKNILKLTVVIKNQLVEHSTARFLAHVLVNHVRSELVQGDGVSQRFTVIRLRVQLISFRAT